MKTKFLLYTFLFTFIAVAANSNPPTLPHINGFTENLGQITNENGEPVPNVLYSYATENMNVFITTSGISYVFWDSAKIAKQLRLGKSHLPTGGEKKMMERNQT